MARILNPEAVGDPDWEPIVELDEGLVAGLMRAGMICGCGGMNGWHGRSCPNLPPDSDKVLDDDDPSASDEREASQQ